MKNPTAHILTWLALSSAAIPAVADTTAASCPAAAHGVHAPREAADSLPVFTLDNLDVVALKQQAGIESMAVSGTILTLAEIERDNVVDIKSLSDVVPNFFVADYGSRITSSIYVRGIGARMDQPAVALSIDNMPVLNKDAYDLDIPDIAEAEMLRGPQSSLFGRNSMTGLISIRTLSPMKWQGWRASAEIASGKLFKVNGGWYHKFNSNTALSLNLSALTSQGRFRNLHNGKKIDTERSASLRSRFEWQPSRRLSLSNALSASILRQGGYPYEYIPTGEINYNDTCFYRRFLLNDALTMRFSFSGWSLTSVTSLQHLDDNMTLDQDFLPLSYFTLTQKKQETSFTEEIVARSDGSAPYGWLGGLFAFYRHIDMQAPVTFGDTGIASLIESHRNEANNFYPIAWDSRNFRLDSDFTLPSFGVAFYHESRLNLGSWRLSAALRLDYERVGLRYHSHCDTGYTIYENPSGELPMPGGLNPYRHVGILIDDHGRTHTDFLTLLPKVSALYDLPGDIGNVYACFGKGYKAGGFNTQMFSDVLQQRLMNVMGIGSTYKVEDIVTYRPEYSFNYEIGAHLQPLPALQTDISLFLIDCRDQQLTMFPDGTTTGRIMTNAGKTRSFGMELQLNWSPLSWLDIIASYGYTNARFVKFNDGRADYAGNFVPYAPRNTLFLQPVATLSGNILGKNRVIIDAGLSGTGCIYWNEANSLRQPLYLRLSASITYATDKWELKLWGKNLTDTKYHTFYFMSMGNEFLQRGEPLAIGITARLHI